MSGTQFFSFGLAKKQNKADGNKSPSAFSFFVGEEGLEPSRLAALAPKASVYAISPLAHE